ncbi:MAG: hypothetical protein U1E48_04550 [Paracoccaceae bacterium]
MFVADRSNARLRRRRGRTVVRALASSPVITILTSPALNIANLRPGIAIGAAWAAGSYSAPTGPCTEGAKTYRVNGATVAAAYLLQVGDVVQMAIVNVTAPGGLSLLVGADPAPFSSFTVQAVAPEWRGYLPAVDYGTAFDKYVAPGGSDTAPGTLAQPYATIEFAAKTNPGARIGVRGGIYRVAETKLNAGASGTAGAPTRIYRYGSEQVVLSACEVLTGLTACTAADAAVVGADWAAIDKVTLPDTAVPGGSPYAFYPREQGQIMALSGEWIVSPRNKIETNNAQDWPAGWTVVTGPNGPNAKPTITGWQNAAITDKYTQAEIEAMRVYHYCYPNLATANSVASFDPATKTINLTGTSKEYDSGATYKDRVGLRNIPKNICEGEWAFKANGDGTTTYFLRLANRANVSGGVEYSARSRNFDFNGANYVNLFGLILEGTASDTGLDEDVNQAVISQNPTVGNRLSNCWIRRHVRSKSRVQFGLYMASANDFTLDQSSITECYGMYGFHPKGNPSPASMAQMTKGLLVYRCLFEKISSTAVRIYGQRAALIALNLWASDVGMSPHANRIDPKQDSHDIVIYANDFSGGTGYLTFQRASAIHIIGNYLPANYLPTDTRAVVDQNSNAAGNQVPAQTWGVSGLGYVFGNHIAPDPQDTTATNGITVGVNSAVSFDWRNNILFKPSAAIGQSTRTNNWCIGGTALAGEFSETMANAYVDAVNGDFTLKSTSGARTQPGLSVATEMAYIASLVPQAPAGLFQTDLNGDPIDWSAPPMGPTSSGDIRSGASIFATLPQLVGGANAVGSTLDVDAGLTAPAGITRTYQWFRGSSLKAWVPIGGANGRTYDVQSADAGYYLSRKASIKNTVAHTIIASQVLSSYPISSPVSAFAPLVTSTNGTQYESVEFTLENRPLLVRIMARLSGTAATTYTVTVGPKNRPPGTGTVLTALGSGNRSNAAIGAAFLVAPGTGLVTIQITASTTVNGLIVLGHYVDGATAATGFNSTGLTAAAIDHFRSTTKSNCVVAYLGARNNGTLGAASLTGAAQIYEGKSGTATDDVEAVAGYEQAPGAATYGAHMDGVSSTTIILGAVILESALSA